MQDPTSITSFPEINNTLQYPEQEHLKCPRCDSNNTKFCYYNNYNLSQPRHYCKSCRRYWTKGGALRNIPIGGGTRKITKRSSSSSSSSSLARTRLLASGLNLGSGRNDGTDTKSGSVLVHGVGPDLGLEGQFGNCVVEGLGSNNGLELGKFNGPGLDSGLELVQGDGGSTSCWSDSNNGWPNLTICSQSGSKFH